MTLDQALAQLQLRQAAQLGAWWCGWVVCMRGLVARVWVADGRFLVDIFQSAKLLFWVVGRVKPSRGCD